MEKIICQKLYHCFPIFKLFEDLTSPSKLLGNKTDIFFDLDHTLWDYDRNCEEALQEIFVAFNLPDLGIKVLDDFINQFHLVNNRLWNCYDTRQISAEELRFRRFREIFDVFEIKAKAICDKIHFAYMDISPNKPYLFEGAIEVLEYLQPKYALHIITNGMVDNQAKKMEASGINPYFKTITTSQKAASRKPEKEIFEYALNLANTTADQSVMIGDNYEVDILGAQNAGIDAIYFNTKKNNLVVNEKSMINHLLELKQIL